MSHQADAQRLPTTSTSGAFEVPNMEPSADQPPPPPAFVDSALDDGAARSKKRRAWLIIGAAVLIPAGLAAALVAIFAGGSTTPVAEPAAPVVTAAATATTPSVTLPDPDRPTAVRADSEQTAATATAATGADTSTTNASTTAAASTTTESAAAEAQAETSAPLTPAEQLAAWPDTTVVEVNEGDTLWAFAEQYSTTVEAIEMLNGVRPQDLEIGQRLTIPIGFVANLSNDAAESSGSTVAWRTPSTTTSVAAEPGTPLSQWPNITQVEVVYGNTLNGIAADYGTTIEAIMVLSGLTNPHQLYPGDILTVPVGYAETVASVSVPEWVASDPEPAPAVSVGDGAAVTAPPAAAPAEETTATSNLLLAPESETTTTEEPAAAAASDDELMFEEDEPAAPAAADDELMFEEDPPAGGNDDDLLLAE